jgi:hypothetical protein
MKQCSLSFTLLCSICMKKTKRVSFGKNGVEKMGELGNGRDSLRTSEAVRLRARARTERQGRGQIQGLRQGGKGKARDSPAGLRYHWDYSHRFLGN